MTKISVIIPTTKEHHKYLQDAVQSVDFDGTEVVVVNDSTTEIKNKSGIDVIMQRREETPFGAGKARNIGVDNSSGVCIVFLDADDYLLPGALEAMWEQYQKTGHIVYGNLIRFDSNQQVPEARFVTEEQYCGPVLEKTALSLPKRPYCCLIPREVHYKAGKYNEEMRTWEDIDYEIRCDIVSCADKIDKDIYYYRMDLGKRRRIADIKEEKQAARRAMYESHKKYFKGEKIMGCSGCGNSKPTVRVPMTASQEVQVPETGENEVLLIEYIAPTKGARDFIGPESGERHRFGQSKRRRFKVIGNGEGEVPLEDAKEMVKQKTRHFDLFRFRIVDNETREVKVAPSSESIPVVDRVVVSEDSDEDVPVMGSEEAEELVQEKEEEMMVAPGPQEWEEAQEEGESYREAHDPESVEAEEVENKAAQKEGVKRVSEFTVSEMKEEVESADQATIKLWHKQELGEMSPRKTMLGVLESAMEDEE